MLNVNITDTGAYSVSQKKLLGIPVPVFTLHISRQSDYFRYYWLCVTMLGVAVIRCESG